MNEKFLPYLQKDRAEIFRSFFGSNENIEICFWCLLTFSIDYKTYHGYFRNKMFNF